METGLPGKVGLPVAKHVATGRGFEYDCVIIPPRPTKERIVKGKENIQKIVSSAIVQVNFIFLGGGDGWHFRLSMMLHFHSHLPNLSPKGYYFPISSFVSLSMYVWLFSIVSS